MKFTIPLALVLSFQSMAFTVDDDDIVDADKETVTEIYEYCMSLQDVNAVVDKALLKCINDELAAGGFNQFKSLEEVKVIID